MTIGDLEQRFHKELTALYAPVLRRRLFNTLGEHTLNMSTAQLRIYQGRTLSKSEELSLTRALHKLCRGVPLAYVLGKETFYQRLFLVNDSVLIPREETEDLVSLALTERRDSTYVDIGAGSGAIAITIARERPDARVLGSDVSRKALAVAKKNAKIHNADIHWFQGSLLHSKLKVRIEQQSSPIIFVANLPYLPLRDKTSVHPTVAREPSRALYSGEDGLLHYRRLFSQLTRWKWAKTHFWTLLCEYDPPQTKTLLLLAKQLFPRAKRSAFRDRFGRTRFLRIDYFPDSALTKSKSSVTT